MMSKIAGSQLVVFDIARLLIASGAKVTIISPVIGEPMKSLLVANDINIVDLLDPGVAVKLPNHADLLIGLHWPVLGMSILQYRISYRHLVLMSLSPYEPIEAVWFLTEEADAIWLNSLENRDHHRKLNHNNVFVKKAEIFPNSLPAEWFQESPTPPKMLNKVLFISNRSSTRTEPLKAGLRSNGIDVREIGLRREERLVDCALVDEYDSIVSIGHSVQKAMARKRPIFVFDRFGGPGWLTSKNFESLSGFNFSGRGSTSLTVDETLTAFVGGFGDACAEMSTLFTLAKKNFELERNLLRLLSRLGARSSVRRASKLGNFGALRASQAFFSVRFPGSVNAAEHAPGVVKAQLNLEANVQSLDGPDVFFHCDRVSSEATLFGVEADFSVSGIGMAMNGGKFFIQAERDDGVVFITDRFLDSPILARKFPRLLAARKSRFKLNIVTKLEGSSFKISGFENGRSHFLGRINVNEVKPLI